MIPKHVLTPSECTFQVNALIFSPIPESLVAVMIRSRTPTKTKKNTKCFKISPKRSTLKSFNFLQPAMTQPKRHFQLSTKYGLLKITITMFNTMAQVFPNTSCSYCNQLERIGEDQISSILNENEFLDAEIP